MTCPRCQSSNLKELPNPNDGADFVLATYHTGEDQLCYDSPMKCLNCQACDEEFYVIDKAK